MFTPPSPCGTNGDRCGGTGCSVITELQHIFRWSNLYPGDGGSSIPELPPKHKHCPLAGARDKRLEGRGRATNLGSSLYLGWIKARLDLGTWPRGRCWYLQPPLHFCSPKQSQARCQTGISTDAALWVSFSPLQLDEGLRQRGSACCCHPSRPGDLPIPYHHLCQALSAR